LVFLVKEKIREKISIFQQSSHFAFKTPKFSGISFDISNHLKFLGITKPTATQLGVALSMAHIAGQKPIDFVINLGDNVYWNGVADVNDARFRVSNVYCMTAFS
jgi:hypothetical protein